MEQLNRIVITDILEVVTVASSKGRFEKMTNRKCYGLSFCEQGQITYTQNGVEFICDPTHAILLPKGQDYTIRGDKSGHFPVINFECAEFLCDTITVLPVDNIAPIIKDFLQMKHLFLFEVNRAKVFGLFYMILHQLTACAIAKHHTLLPAMRYLEKNDSSAELSNAVLAAECQISEVYFRKLFVATYGISPGQYVIDIRINKAKQLLTDGFLKINAVSEQCGFSNPYHFCRLFKQKTGLTPTEYRKQTKMSTI